MKFDYTHEEMESEIYCYPQLKIELKITPDHLLIDWYPKSLLFRYYLQDRTVEGKRI